MAQFHRWLSGSLKLTRSFRFRLQVHFSTSAALNKTMAPKYTLLYWDGIPGRAEYIRLAFEYTKTPFDEKNGFQSFSKYLSPNGLHFAPPLLRITRTGDDSDTTPFVLSQTPAILEFIAPRLGLAGSNEYEKATVNQLTLTALDFSNEAHDVHHPIASSLYYEDQKPEAKRRAEDFTTNRIPKIFTHFQTVLKANLSTQIKTVLQGNNDNTTSLDARVLVGSAVSAADLTLFQVVDGLLFAFPKRMGTLRKSGEYVRVFALHERIKGELSEYLESKRRLEYSSGVYRYYPELDQE